jgi:hypothetical protein
MRPDAGLASRLPHPSTPGAKTLWRNIGRFVIGHKIQLSRLTYRPAPLLHIQPNHLPHPLSHRDLPRLTLEPLHLLHRHSHLEEHDLIVPTNSHCGHNYHNYSSPYKSNPFPFLTVGLSSASISGALLFAFLCHREGKNCCLTYSESVNPTFIARTLNCPNCFSVIKTCNIASFLPRFNDPLGLPTPLIPTPGPVSVVFWGVVVSSMPITRKGLRQNSGVT